MATDFATQVDLEVKLIEDDHELDAVADAWNALAHGVPFRRHEWLATWWRHFRKAGDKLFIPTIYDADGQIIGLAPWYVENDRWMGRVVRFLGSGKVCSEYLTILAAHGAEEVVAHRLAAWLAIDGAPHWDLLDLDGVDQQDEMLTRIVGELSEAGHEVFQRARERTWRVTLAATWDEFLGGLSKARRAKLRALDRRLEGGRVSLQTADNSEKLQQGLDIFHRLHQARRASLGGDGCLSLPAFERFLEDAAARFLRLGDLRLQWIEVDGEPAAVEFDLLGDDTLYYYQTGMNPNLAEISPGRLLQVASIKRAIGESTSCFDFLRGDEAYKASWGAEPQQLVQIRIAARRPLARLRHELWMAALAGKNRWLAAKGQTVCGKEPS
jgi:CelD/BcsL family acetyltransferase involved in cellulose biosynthesis